MSKKELFYEVINLMQELPEFNMGPCAIRETDEIISYSFDSTSDHCRKHMEEVKEYVTTKGYTVTADLYDLVHNKVGYKEYHTVLYNKTKDKISLGRFLVGYAWSARKNRVYPYRIKQPVLCVSKHIYHFWHKNKPRILTGTYANGSGAYDKIIDRVFLKVGYTSNIRISYRYFIGTSNQWEAMENYFGRPIPLELREVRPQTVFYLYIEFFGPRSKEYTLEAPLNLKKIDQPHLVVNMGNYEL